MITKREFVIKEHIEISLCKAGSLDSHGHSNLISKD